MRTKSEKGRAMTERVKTDRVISEHESYVIMSAVADKVIRLMDEDRVSEAMELSTCWTKLLDAVVGRSADDLTVDDLMCPHCGSDEFTDHPDGESAWCESCARRF